MSNEANRRNTSPPRAPADDPAYTIVEASCYLHVPHASIRLWVLGRPYPVRMAAQQVQPVIRLANASQRLLSFENLVEVHVLSAVRTEHRVRLDGLRAAVRRLEADLDTTHPLADLNKSSSRIGLFVSRLGESCQIPDEAKLALESTLKAHLDRVVGDDQGVALRLLPYFNVRHDDRDLSVVIDPRVQSGRPCLTGTGVPTAEVAERFKAGTRMADLSHDFGATLEQTEAAIRFELKLPT